VFMFCFNAARVVSQFEFSHSLQNSWVQSGVLRPWQDLSDLKGQKVALFGYARSTFPTYRLTI